MDGISRGTVRLVGRENGNVVEPEPERPGAGASLRFDDRGAGLVPPSTDADPERATGTTPVSVGSSSRFAIETVG